MSEDEIAGYMNWVGRSAAYRRGPREWAFLYALTMAVLLAAVIAVLTVAPRLQGVL